MQLPSRRRPARSLSALSLACAGAVALAGCSGTADADAAGAGNDGLTIVAAFYPLAWLSEQVAGDLATVTSLTPDGAEPHEYELTPRDVAATAEADAVVFLPTLQPAVDAAVEQQAADRAFDAGEAADLSLTYEAHDHEHSDGEHAEEEHAEEEHADEPVTDPHFWHDPMRMADVGDALADHLATVDETNAEQYTANAADLRAQLAELDGEFRDGLADCATRELVTSHSAFGYLADAYDLEQFGISGLAPDEEPSTDALTEATEFVREHGVRTIYFETLVSPAVAETVARETGAHTRQLDPIEGLTDQSQGADYLELMRANLASLRTGQQCS
ncbi:metal ABC transporter substrate-binding protein [Modestobacter sp. VKM Ac-2978]|uniref:metal ABC transporter substrate-binding protein n=1 Tax=Modestobacter sp. VKM Ac-2978 TaxID=3004132 RepID=UPI0022AA8EED|nr:metal ABC transporter substrate-binding protein [Modestobacter sp. VKM Ac-2978]MCZ2848854.1 metal ABC transporter substrate-binding protein [Modestobacter sp. VKM Ac-2978]